LNPRIKKLKIDICVWVPGEEMHKKWEKCEALSEDILVLLKSADPLMRAKGVADLDDFSSPHPQFYDTPVLLPPLVHMLDDPDPFVVILALGRLKVVLGHNINKPALEALDNDELEQAIDSVCLHLDNETQVPVPNEFKTIGFSKVRFLTENTRPVSEYAGKALKWIHQINWGLYDVLSKLAGIVEHNGSASKKAMQLYSELMGGARTWEAAKFIEHPHPSIRKAARDRISDIINGIAKGTETIDPERVIIQDEYAVSQKLFGAVTKFSKVEHVLVEKLGKGSQDELFVLLNSKKESVQHKIDIIDKSICQRIDESKHSGKLRPPGPRLRRVLLR
jgi:hypothetical protein